MKTKQTTKPFNATQIKLLLGEMIRIHNAKVVERNKVIEQLKEKQIERYREVLTKMFQLGGFTEPQVKRLVSWCEHTDDKLGVKKILGDRPYEFHDTYREKGWNCESHPLHAILGRTKLQLHMGTASDYETYIEEFTAQIDKILKLQRWTMW